MTKPHRYLDGKTYCENCKESVINSSIASTSPCRGQATVPVENPQPESPDIERAYQWLLNSDDFDARNLRTTIKSTIVDGADCFDLRGAAKVLVKYAASSIPAMPWATTHKVAEISKRWRMGDPNYEDIPILLKIVCQVFASSVYRQPELVSSLEEVLLALKKSFRGDPVHCADEMISRAELLLNQIDSHPLAVNRLSAKEFWEATFWQEQHGNATAELLVLREKLRRYESSEAKVGRRQEHPDSWWWGIINGAIGQWGGPQYKYFNEAIARIKDVYDNRVAGLDEWGEPLEEAGLPARESRGPQGCIHSYGHNFQGPCSQCAPSRPSHKTLPVPVWADVDEGIAELVVYLNTIPGVRTIASCQGTIGEGGPNPYRAQIMATWPTEVEERLRIDFEITELGENWGYIHPKSDSPVGESGKPLLLCETCGKPKLKHDMSVASGMITSGYFCGCPIALEQVEPTLTYERLPKIIVSHGAPPGVGPGPAVEGESHVPPTHNHSVDTFPQHITKEGVGVWRKDCPACESLGVKSVEVASGKGNYYLPADDEAFRLVVWAMEERPGKTAQDNLAEAISAAIKLGEKRANERKKHEG
jgi:hypothetical protein